MNTTESRLRKMLGREPTPEEVADHKRKKYLRDREKQYEWRRKKQQDPEYWANYLAKCREWRKKRQERKGKTVKPFFKHESEEARIAARKMARKKYVLNNTEKLRAKWREYAKKRHHIALAYQRHRRATDPLFSMAVKLRKRVRAALNFAGARKCQSSVDLVGCSMVELKAHLESQFSEGMTWEIFCAGKIHIDHIVPCAAFDLTDESQQKKCFHYTNLKPSWPVNNLSKSSIYNGKRWYYSDHIKQAA